MYAFAYGFRSFLDLCCYSLLLLLFILFTSRSCLHPSYKIRNKIAALTVISLFAIFSLLFFGLHIFLLFFSLLSFLRFRVVSNTTMSCYRIISASIVLPRALQTMRWFLNFFFFAATAACILHSWTKIKFCVRTRNKRFIHLLINIVFLFLARYHYQHLDRQQQSEHVVMQKQCGKFQKYIWMLHKISYSIRVGLDAHLNVADNLR